MSIVYCFVTPIIISLQLHLHLLILSVQFFSSRRVCKENTTNPCCPFSLSYNLLYFFVEFKTMQEMADHFKMSTNEICNLFSRGVRILSEGGGSAGFKEYHELGVYISEFANRTGFPKFPLKNETELFISRYFQVLYFNGLRKTGYLKISQI